MKYALDSGRFSGSPRLAKPCALAGPRACQGNWNLSNPTKTAIHELGTSGCLERLRQTGAC